ncbi:DUF3905 domain-containing protein [Paenibacillus eucommiae]|uniref:DUF3905 domain-containing protein n=1 Tax=Paenibacillus eucommiae TaxID=1355755 RepID=A0ABS4IZ69_9BACL|nr:DUF3905 domain-containing protein [Paenibacillus eucommiae]MBP1992365.1 hypothetical protein [Paenibacillus eucommiae]
MNHSNPEQDREQQRLNETKTSREDKQVTDTDEDASLDPYEINFLPQYMENRGPREPFVNGYGVTIGDHEYESAASPLSQWNEDTDPSVMAGDQWVHPFKDIGFHTAENRDYFEKGILPQSEIFMHPDKDAAYEYKVGQGGSEAGSDEEQEN